MADARPVLEVVWMGLIASLECVICARFEQTGLQTELHHTAEGSAPRSNFGVVPLCGSRTNGGHHRGKYGFHGMGERAFCSCYGVPWDNEYGLLVWRDEDLIKKLRFAFPAIVTRLGRLRGA